MEASGHARWFERLLAELRWVSIASTGALFLNGKAFQPSGRERCDDGCSILAVVEAEGAQSRVVPLKQKYRTLSPAESP
jgi:hypothetical protein